MKGKNNNKGYTLVELLLTLVIFGIVMIGITMIMRTTSVSYRNGSYEVSIQTEAQIVANQIEDLFVDATSYYGETGATGYTYYRVESGSANHFIIYKDSTDEIWYQKDTTGTMGVPSGESSWALMAENVEGFRVSGYSTDPSVASCDNMVAVEVTIKKEGYSYTAVKDVYFRNSIENTKVMEIDNGAPAPADPTDPYTDVYLDRYQVLDLVRDYDLDLTQSVTITGLGTDTYRLVMPNYATGNTTTAGAITGVTTPTGATLAEQIVTCQTDGKMALVTTDAVNSNLNTQITATDNVTVVATNNSGATVKLRILTKKVAYEMSSTPSADGVIHMTTGGGSSNKYHWINIEGIHISNMINIFDRSFQYSMVLYEDEGSDNKYTSTTERFLDQNQNVAGPLNAITIDTVQHYSDGGGTKDMSNGPDMNFGLIADPESGDFVILNGNSIGTGDVAKLNLGNVRLAFLIELPGTVGDARYQIVDLALAAQADGGNMNNYDGGFLYDANATTWGSLGF